MIDRFDLHKVVDFKGFIDGKEKVTELGSSDIFLLPSYEEGAPNVLVESMAAGNYIIASNVTCERRLLFGTQFNGFPLSSRNSTGLLCQPSFYPKG